MDKFEPCLTANYLNFLKEREIRKAKEIDRLINAISERLINVYVNEEKDPYTKLIYNENNKATVKLIFGPISGYIPFEKVIEHFEGVGFIVKDSIDKSYNNPGVDCEGNKCYRHIIELTWSTKLYVS